MHRVLYMNTVLQLLMFSITTANHKISNPEMESGLHPSASQARNVSFNAFDKTYNSNILQNASVSGKVGSITGLAEGISFDHHILSSRLASADIEKTTKSAFISYVSRAALQGRSLNSDEQLATTSALQTAGPGVMVGTLNDRQGDQDKSQMALKEEDTSKVQTTTSLMSHSRQFATYVTRQMKVMEHINDKIDHNINPTMPFSETTGSYESASANTSFKHEDDTATIMRQYDGDKSSTLSTETENVNGVKTSKKKMGTTEVPHILSRVQENETSFTVAETNSSFVENGKGNGTTLMTTDRHNTQRKSDTTAIPILVPMFREIDICLLARRKDGKDSKLVEIPCKIPSKINVKPSTLIRLCGISTSVWDVTMAYDSKCQNLTVTKEDEDRLIERGLGGIKNGKIIDVKVICITNKVVSLSSFDSCALEAKLLKDVSEAELFKLASDHCGLQPKREQASIRVADSRSECGIPLINDIDQWNGVYLWLLFAICCIGIVGNSFTIFLFYKGGLERSGKSNPAVYFTTMLALDIINLFTKVIRCLVLLKAMRPLNPIVCRLSIGIQLMVSVGSMLSIIALTVERYIAVCHPLKAKFLLTKSRQNKVNKLFSLSFIFFYFLCITFRT